MHRVGNLLNKIARPMLNSYDPNRLTRSILNSYDPNRHARPILNCYDPNRHDLSQEASMIRSCYFWEVYPIYITAAFRSSVENEAYLFMCNEYVLLNYGQGTQDDKVLEGPNFIFKGFPPLKNTKFDDRGITCAFGSHYGNEAYIFSGNTCARIGYAPGSSNVKILRGPTRINKMFPFLMGTAFEDGWSAAFESWTIDEAYLFDGDKYARINYRDGRVICINPTFTCLKNTIFESGIDAAFASHKTDEAYLFKSDSYALINFADDYIIGGVKKIIPDGWPSLNSALPRDVHVDHLDHNHSDYSDEDYGDHSDYSDEDYGDHSDYSDDDYDDHSDYSDSDYSADNPSDYSDSDYSAEDYEEL